MNNFIFINSDLIKTITVNYVKEKNKFNIEITYIENSFKTVLEIFNEEDFKKFINQFNNKDKFITSV